LSVDHRPKTKHHAKNKQDNTALLCH
jgi:hypothetical protein